MRVYMVRSYATSEEVGHALLAGNQYDLDKDLAMRLVSSNAAIPVVVEERSEKAVLKPLVEKRTRGKKV